MEFHQFAKWFRASSPYIREHRDRVFAILLTKECIRHDGIRNIVRDLALLHVLDIKLLLIVEAEKGETRENLRMLKELFARGLPSSKYRNQAIALKHHSIDSPSKALTVDTKKVRDISRDLDNGFVVAVSQANKAADVAANISIDNLTQEVALALAVDKLILFHEPATPFNALDFSNSDYSIQAFRAAIKVNQLSVETEHRMKMLAHVCFKGVKRGHLVSYVDNGALLAELFTPDGSGTQVSTDDYLTIRPATTNDADSILELIQMDIDEERLIPRSRALLLSDSSTIFIAEHDGIPVGCVALYTLVRGWQEIGTLLAATHHRDKNVGTRLLLRAESEAKKREAKKVFVFTKHAVDWFLKHDYEPTELSALPKSRQKQYDHERQSTLLMKDIR